MISLQAFFHQPPAFSLLPAQHNPADADTFAEGTVKLDILGRQVMQTTWLSPRGTIDPNSVPIAGLDADGSGSLDAPVADGLTSIVVYDHNLGDGFGLETTGGMSVPNPGSLTPVNVSANAILAQLTTDTGMIFGAGHSGSATLSVNAEGETSLTISDALGRTVMVAQTQPHTQQVGLVAVAWSYMIYDNTQDIGTGGVPFLVAETRTRDAFGNISQSRSDGAGRVLQNVDEAGNITRMTYSATSELLSVRDPNDVGYDAVFDQLGRELSRTDTYGNITSTGYDRNGNAISQTDGKGQTTQFQYDAADRRIRVIDRLAGNTVYGYDLNGNEISIVDAEGQTTLYAYNSRGHRSSETFPDHVGGSNPGDGNGLGAWGWGLAEKKKMFQTRRRVSLRLSPATAVLSASLPPAPGLQPSARSSAHDRMGRMATGVSGRYSNTIAFSFDDMGRPASESLTISGQTYTTSYAHDAMNRRSGMTLPDGSVVLRTYTNRSQLHQAKLNGVTLDTRTYDAGGRHSTSTYGNGVVITHAYRTNGSLKDDLLASITTTHPGGIPSGQQVGDYTYTWDANRNKLSESITGILSGRGFQPVTYDNEERLTAWSRSDGNQSQTWSLSLVGDWSTHAQTGTVAFTQNRVHGPAHEFTSFTGTNSGTLTYDSKGNNTARPATLAAPALNLNWDFGNQLSGVDTNGTPASLEVTYRYDVLGRRVGRVEGGSSIVFVQAGQQTIADYDAGQVPTKPNQIYVYGSYIDEPIARRESGNLAYFHRNQQYSIVAISNSSGAVIERYSYTAHGQPTVYDAAGTIIPAPTFGNRFTYTGREWDATIAMHYFRARWYDPLAGRFTSRDPLGYVDGMSHYISYLGLSKIDPLGTEILGGRRELDDVYPEFVKSAYGAPCEVNCNYAADLCKVCRVRRAFLKWKAWRNAECDSLREECKSKCRLQRQKVQEMGLDPNNPDVFSGIGWGVAQGVSGATVGVVSAKSGRRIVRVTGVTAGAAFSVYGWWSAYITILEVQNNYRPAIRKKVRGRDDRFRNDLQPFEGTNCRGTRFNGVFFPGYCTPTDGSSRKDSVLDNAHGFWLESCNPAGAADRTVQVNVYGYFGPQGWQKTILEQEFTDERMKQCFTWDELLAIEMEMKCVNLDERTCEPSKR